MTFVAICNRFHSKILSVDEGQLFEKKPCQKEDFSACEKDAFFNVFFIFWGKCSTLLGTPAAMFKLGRLFFYASIDFIKQDKPISGSKEVPLTCESLIYRGASV